MVKKILKITGITFGVLLIAGFSIPYLFEKQIKEKIKNIFFIITLKLLRKNLDFPIHLFPSGKF